MKVSYLELEAMSGRNGTWELWSVEEGQGAEVRHFLLVVHLPCSPIPSLMAQLIVSWQQDLSTTKAAVCWRTNGNPDIMSMYVS